MRGRGGEHEALREVVRELRGEAPVEPNWDVVESRLMRRIREEQPVARSKMSLGLFGLGLVFAAALVMLIVRGALPLGNSVTTAPAVTAKAQPSLLDGAQLALGQAISADASSLTVEHRGHAKWVLSPHSDATLVSSRDTIVVRLTRGSLSAEVVPVHRPESFVVEAAGMRVAVHGTKFRVELAENVRVEVTEGVVVVRPRVSTTSDRQWRLPAPATGDFAPDGSTGEVRSAATSTPSATAVSEARRAVALERRVTQSLPSSRVPASASAPEQVAEPAEIPNKPLLGDVETGMSTLISLVEECFAKRMPSRGDVRVTARSALTVSIGPDGHIVSHSFEPPLAPSVSQCAEAGARTVHFAPSHEGSTVTRLLELSR